MPTGAWAAENIARRLRDLPELRRVWWRLARHQIFHDVFRASTVRRMSARRRNGEAPDSEGCGETLAA